MTDDELNRSRINEQVEIVLTNGNRAYDTNKYGIYIRRGDDVDEITGFELKKNVQVPKFATIDDIKVRDGECLTTFWYHHSVEMLPTKW